MLASNWLINNMAFVCAAAAAAAGLVYVCLCILGQIMDKLLDKEVHQLFRASPNDPEMSNYVVSSCTKHSTVDSAASAGNAEGLMIDRTADEGLGGEDEAKPDSAADSGACTQGKTKSKSSQLLG